MNRRPLTRRELLERLSRLTADARPRWGRMTAPQMLTHVNDQFRMALGDLRRTDVLQSHTVETAAQEVAAIVLALPLAWFWVRRAIPAGYTPRLLALLLLSSRFELDDKRRDFDYYEAVTTHDSSLSSCIYSIVAAEVGRVANVYAPLCSRAVLDGGNQSLDERSFSAHVSEDLDLSERIAIRKEDIRGGSGIFRYHDAGLQPTLRDVLMQMIATSLRQGIQKLLEFMALLNSPDNIAVDASGSVYTKPCRGWSWAT